MPPIDLLTILPIVTSLLIAVALALRGRLKHGSRLDRRVRTAVAAWTALGLWQAWQAWRMQSSAIGTAASLPLLGWLSWRALRAGGVDDAADLSATRE